VLHGQPLDGLGKCEAALADWVRKVVADANTTTREDVDGLRRAGFSEREIFESTALVGFRIAFSTVNHAPGAQPDAPLAVAAPPPVCQSLNFGRPVGRRSP